MGGAIRNLAGLALSPGQRAMLACVLEATARKPGNVHPAARFTDLCYADFLAAAAAIRAPFDRTGELGVGGTVLECVRQTRRLVASNVNLGIVLLLAPLSAVPAGIPLAIGIEPVLNALTIADSRAVYEAIRLAQPGGMGTVAEQDIGAEPTESLRVVMARAAARDSVARQYAIGFTEVLWGASLFKSPAPVESLDWEHAVIQCHLAILARHPDTLIARMRGPAEAHEASRRAADVLAAQWPVTPESRRLFHELDDWLRAAGHERNPGTTADLVTASLFAALCELCHAGQ